jgi:hypothetical protein
MLLAGCQDAPQRVATGSRIYHVDVTGGAKVCNAAAITSPTPGKELPATISMNNDGGWCGVSVDNGGRAFSAGLLLTRPAHGRAYVHSVGDTTRLDFTPNAGFTGSDSFAVRLLPGESVIRVGVTVTK